MNVFDLYAKISLDTSDYEKGLSSAKKSAQDSKSDVVKLANQYEKSGSDMSDAMEKAFSDIGESAKESAQTAKKAATTTGNSWEDVTSSLKNIESKFSTLTTAFKANFIIDGIKTVASGLLELEEATEEYRTAQGKLNTAFEAAGYSADVAQEAYSGFYAILGDTDTATEASQLLSELALNAEDVSEWVDIAAGVYGKFGDSIETAGLIEGINQTQKLGEVNGILADALDFVGIKTDDFNAALADCSNEAERNQLIMDTLSDAYSDASDAFYENNEQLVQNRENQQKLDDAMAEVGDSVSRLKNAFLNEYTPAIETAAGATANFLDTLANPSTWASIGEKLTWFQTFSGELITGSSISEAKATAERIANQYYRDSGEAARQAAKEVQAADDSVVSNAQKNAFILQQNAKETSESVSSTATESAEKTSSKVTATTQKAVEKQKTLFEQLQESFKSASDSYATNASVAALELEVWQNEFGDTATSAEQMSHQLESLNTQLAEQKNTVDAAQSAYDQIVASYGEASNEAAQFRQTLLQETATYQELQKQVEETAKSITDSAYKSVSDTWGTKASIAVLEFETWSNAFEDTATESEKLEKQLESLKAQEQAQKEVVDAAQKAYDDLVAAYGETSDEALEYKEILLQETKAHQELQSEIDDTTEALKKATDETEQFKIALNTAFEETNEFGGAISSLGSSASDLGDVLGIDLVSDIGAMISKMGGGISSVINFANSLIQVANSVSTVTSALSNLASIASTVSSGGGLLSTIGSIFGGSTGVLGTLALGGAAVGAVGTAEIIKDNQKLWNDESKSFGEKLFGTISNGLWAASGVGTIIKGFETIFGKKEKENALEDSASNVQNSIKDQITTGTVSGVTTSGGNTIIERVEIFIEGSQYKDEDSLAEAISIKLQNLTERKVNVFA